MSTSQWAVKDRPRKLNDFVGQPAAVAFLRGLIKKNEIPGCMLISGQSGSGKTTFARLAAALFTGGPPDPEKNPDIREAHANVESGKDDVRELIEFSRYLPSKGKRRCIIVDEAHLYSSQASGALLKATEEPPPKTTWILCTDQPHKLPRQLAMRGQSVALGPVSDEDLTELLLSLLERHECDLGKAQDAIIKRIVEASYGVPRQAVALLYSVSTTVAGGGKPSEALKMAIRTNSVTESFDASIQFIKAVLSNNTVEAIKVLNGAGSCDGMIELIIRMLTAVVYSANGGKPKDGLGWAAVRAIGRVNLGKALDLQKRVIAAMSIRVSSNYQVPSESLLLALAKYDE